MSLRKKLSGIAHTRRRVRSLREELADERDVRAELEIEGRDLRTAAARERGLDRVGLGRIEKWDGRTSFLATARMLQRVNEARARSEGDLPEEYRVTRQITQLRDPTFTTRLAESHGLPTSFDEEMSGILTVHAFQGETGFVELPSTDGIRYLSDAGEPLGVEGVEVESGPPEPPGALEQIMETSRRLSSLIPFAYAQVRWQGEADRISLMSIDPDPEVVPDLGRDLDESLGEMIERAQARILARAHQVRALENRTPEGIFMFKEER